jgi:hypothetical protein
MIDLFFRSLSDLMSQELQELFHGGHSQNSTDGNQQIKSDRDLKKRSIISSCYIA